MLNFVENYYEVTDQNKDLLRRKMIEEDIRAYNGDKADISFLVRIGHVLGNKRSSYPNRTGFWSSRETMNTCEQKKITTDIVKPLMKVD